MAGSARSPHSAATPSNAMACLKEFRLNRPLTPHARAATLTGGAALIAATLLFSGVFVYLARHFGYPEVLDLSAAEVLPRLRALGGTGRAVWMLYALVPLLLIPTAFGVHAARAQAAPLAVRVALTAAVLSALSMTLGLARWPTLHWQLAAAYADATPPAREAIAAVFAASNSYLGNFIGEFLGELFLNTFFFSAALALTAGTGGMGRWLRVAGTAASLIGAIAMLRHVLPGVQMVSAVNNLVLPIWMLVLGGALLRHASGAPRAA